MSVKTSPRRAVRMIARQPLAEACRARRMGLSHAPHGTCPGVDALAA